MQARSHVGRRASALAVALAAILLNSCGPSGDSLPVGQTPASQAAAYLKASNTGAADQFGAAVALDGDTLVVGAPEEDSSARGVNSSQSADASTTANHGAVYVFVRSGGVWVQQAYIKPLVHDALDNFGQSVAISGNTLVVGAPGEDSGIRNNPADNSALGSGAAYVFVRDGTTWTQQAYLKASSIAANASFGSSVAISGDTLAVGAPGDGGGGNEAGAVFVFTGQAGVWTQQAAVRGANTATGDRFGFSIALGGDTLAVGATGEDNSATGVSAAGHQENDLRPDSGAAYVFTRTGTIWTQQAHIKASNPDGLDEFGWAVALSGETLAVSSREERSAAVGINGNQTDNTAVDAGAVYIFIRNGTLWTQQAYVKASNTEAGDAFGNGVALDGDTLAVGASQESSVARGLNGNQADDSRNAAGAVYVYTRTGTTWSQRAYVKATNTDAGDTFGTVAISGATLAVGAVGEDSAARGINANQNDNSAQSSGAVYVFDL
jgi:hypothetical protein